jgi:hypothetical protein
MFRSVSHCGSFYLCVIDAEKTVVRSISDLLKLWTFWTLCRNHLSCRRATVNCVIILWSGYTGRWSLLVSDQVNNSKERGTWKSALSSLAEGICPVQFWEGRHADVWPLWPHVAFGAGKGIGKRNLPTIIRPLHIFRIPVHFIITYFWSDTRGKHPPVI